MIIFSYRSNQGGYNSSFDIYEVSSEEEAASKIADITFSNSVSPKLIHLIAYDWSDILGFLNRDFYERDGHLSIQIIAPHPEHFDLSIDYDDELKIRLDRLRLISDLVDKKLKAKYDELRREAEIRRAQCDIAHQKKLLQDKWNQYHKLRAELFGDVHEDRF